MVEGNNVASFSNMLFNLVILLIKLIGSSINGFKPKWLTHNTVLNKKLILLVR